MTQLCRCCGTVVLATVNQQLNAKHPSELLFYPAQHLDAVSVQCLLQDMCDPVIPLAARWQHVHAALSAIHMHEYTLLSPGAQFWCTVTGLPSALLAGGCLTHGMTGVSASPAEARCNCLLDLRDTSE